MSFEGDLRSAELWQILFRLAVQQRTGILTVQGENDIVAVSLLAGGIVAADALNQTVEEGLGQVLTSRGLVSGEDFAAVSREHQGGSGGSLGDALVARGLLSREQLLEGLRVQTYRLMLEVITWREGEFKFYGGDEVSYEEGFVPIPVEELLVRSIDDLAAGRGPLEGPLPSAEATYRRLPPRQLVQVIGRDGDGTGPGVWLTEAEFAFLAQVDGEQSAGVIAERRGMDRYQTLFCLYRLLRRDLIERVAAGRVAPSAAAPRESPAPAAPEVAPRPAPRAPPPAVAPPQLTLEVATWHPWAAWLLAAFLALAVGLTFLLRPGSLLLPFPWQEGQRLALQRQLRRSQYLRIDRAARTFFLIEAHYPDSLVDLTEHGLLAGADLTDASGHPFAYTTDEVSYRVAPFVDDRAVEELGHTEGITGDFYLDPHLLPVESSRDAPLYLMD